MNKLHLFSRSGSKAIKVSKTNEVTMFKLSVILATLYGLSSER